MSIESEPKHCPKCGGPIPAEAPQGLCPKCLLQQAALATETGAAQVKSPPPTREELSAAFPQLEILELIGQGGMGFVFKARQPKLDRFVALKILPQSLAADPAFAERFTREGRVLARLNHPNIVTVHDFGQANGFFYLLMEFVDGVNLRQAMKVGRFTPAQALTVVPKICEALQFAHNEGILHRDIKPENILLDSKGRVKIADFGIAKLVGAGSLTRHSATLSASDGERAGVRGAPVSAALTQTGKALGTPQYMAPEQLEHPQDVDHRADIYSLGVVFYEMLTGELPIGRFAPPSEKSAVDPRMDEVVLRTLEKERERRTQTAGDLKTQVETISASEVSGAEPQANRRMARHFGRGVRVGLLVFFLTIAAATLITFLMPESYLASTRIKLDQVAPSGTAVSPSYDPYMLQTEIEIIQSDAAVLSKVLEDLRLDDRWGQRFGTGKLKPAEVFAVLKSGMDVRPVRNTQLVEIRCFSDSPKEAEIANAIAGSYRTYNQKRFDDYLREHQAAAGGSASLSPFQTLLRVEIVEPAMPPLYPSRPNKPLNIFAGGIIGSGLGLLAAGMTVLLCALKSRWLPSDTVQTPRSRSSGGWKIAAVLLIGGLILMLAIPATWLLLFPKSRTKGPPLRRLPAGQTNSGLKLDFGPVAERVIVDSKAHFETEVERTNAPIMIDFDSGSLLAGPPVMWAADTTSQRAWMQTNGVDAMAVVPGVNGLVGLDMKSVEVPSSAWDDLSASSAAEQLAHANSQETTLFSLGKSLPPTWLFQTREGGMGMLQFTGFTDNPRGVKIRYKVVQSGGALLSQKAAERRSANVTIAYNTSPVTRGELSQVVTAIGTLKPAISDPAKWQIDAMVAQEDVANVEAGQDVRFTMDAFPARAFTGRVLQVSNAPINVQNIVAYGAAIGVNDADPKFRPGMTADVAFIVAYRQSALKIPNAALRFRLPGSSPSASGGSRSAKAGQQSVRTVWLLRGNENSTPVPVTIQTGISDGVFTEVTGGLKEGDRVVIGSASPQAATPPTVTSGSAAVSSSFGPVVERTINLVSTRTNFLIRFKTGDLRTVPLGTNISAPDIYDWVRREGLDAGAGIISSNVLTGFDMAVLPAPAECWEQLTPAEAAQRLDEQPLSTFAIMFHGNRPLPDTCVFKTIQGGTGILQLTGYASDPPGLKVRYKLADMAPAMTQAESNSAATELWSPTLWPGEKPEPEKIYREANDLTAKGKYEAALQRFIWIHNHGLEYGKSSAGVRLSFWLWDWVELGRRYPKARQALVEIRDLKAREFTEGGGYSALFQDVASINSYLQTDDETYVLFKAIRQRDPALARQCYFYVEDLLVKKGEYELCLSYLGEPQSRFESFRRGWEMEKQMYQQQQGTPLPGQSPALPIPPHVLPLPQRLGRNPTMPGIIPTPPTTPDRMKEADKRFVRNVRKLVEILVGVGRKADAETIRDQAVELLDDPGLKSAVGDAEKKTSK